MTYGLLWQEFGSSMVPLTTNDQRQGPSTKWINVNVSNQATQQPHKHKKLKLTLDLIPSVCIGKAEGCLSGYCVFIKMSIHLLTFVWVPLSEGGQIEPGLVFLSYIWCAARSQVLLRVVKWVSYMFQCIRRSQRWGWELWVQWVWPGVHSGGVRWECWPQSGFPSLNSLPRSSLMLRKQTSHSDLKSSVPGYLSRSFDWSAVSPQPLGLIRPVR